MSKVVKILVRDDGEKVISPVWHHYHDIAGGHATFCSGEYFGYGESSAIFKTKNGKITCPQCIIKIKEIKALKL